METGTKLADRFAGLRASPTTPNADTMNLSSPMAAALHALLAAIFARIFGRLEQLLQLWQSGQWPQPGQHPTAPRAIPRQETAARPRAPRITRRRTATTRRDSAPAMPARRPIRQPGPPSLPNHTPQRPTIAAPPPPHARAPPKKRPQAQPKTHTLFITISYYMAPALHAPQTPSASTVAPVTVNPIFAAAAINACATS